jgi:hypothetical protein
LEHDTLHDPRAVANLQELQTPLIGAVVEPAAEGYFLAHVGGDLLNADDLGHDILPEGGDEINLLRL